MRPCYPELSDVSWTGPRRSRKRCGRRPRKANEACPESNEHQPVRTVGPVTLMEHSNLFCLFYIRVLPSCVYDIVAIEDDLEPSRGGLSCRALFIT